MQNGTRLLQSTDLTTLKLRKNKAKLLHFM
nr:MAG TPA: hypothetical protein [Caudoviricetes sp.]